MFPKSQRRVIALYAQNYPQIIRSALKPNLLTRTILDIGEQMSHDWAPGTELPFLQHLFSEVQVIKTPKHRAFLVSMPTTATHSNLKAA